MVGQIGDHLGKPYLKRQAHQLHGQLQRVMRTFGRTCRGQQKVFVHLVRQTEKQLLTVGQCVGPLALKAMLSLYEDTTVAEAKKARLHRQLQQATGHYESIERQSRRLTQGKKLSAPKRVNAYDPTITPILKGKTTVRSSLAKSPASSRRWPPALSLGCSCPPAIPTTLAL